MAALSAVAVPLFPLNLRIPHSWCIPFSLSDPASINRRSKRFARVGNPRQGLENVRLSFARVASGNPPPSHSSELVLY